MIGRKIVFALGVLFIVHALRFYASTIFDFIHSDLAVTTLLGAKCASAKLPVVADWYYANGDVWVLGPQLWAALVIPVFGTSKATVLIANSLGFAVQIALVVWALGKITSTRMASWLGALALLFPWSFMHLLFVWVELSYGWIVSFNIPLFVLIALVFREREPRSPSRRIVLVAGGLASLLVLQNPVRGLVFTILPLTLACLWPYRDIKIRRRLAVSSIAIVGWLIAFVLYRLVLVRAVSLSPHGNVTFLLQQSLHGIVANVKLLAGGVLIIARPRADLPIATLLGLPLLMGAFAFAAHRAFASRELDGLRFVTIAFFAQFAVVLGVLVAGNLVTDEKSIRYLLPGVLGIFAMGSIAAFERFMAETDAKKKLLPLTWLALLPLVGAIAISARFIGPREVFSEADPKKLELVGVELARRNLTHGFATYWNANSMTVLTAGRVKTCAVLLAGDYGLVPWKWVVGTECFSSERLPEIIYFVAHGDVEKASLRRATAASLGLPEPLDRFDVDGDFEVLTYRTSAATLDWMRGPAPVVR